MNIRYSLFLLFLLAPLSANAASLGALAANRAISTNRDFELDRGVGYENTRGAGGGIESAMSLEENRAAQNSKISRALGVSENQPVSTAYGNLIAIETAPDSHVVVNTVQLNQGNQTATIDQLRGFNNTRLNNVETDQNYQDQTVYYQQ